MLEGIENRDRPVRTLAEVPAAEWEKLNAEERQILDKLMSGEDLSEDDRIRVEELLAEPDSAVRGLFEKYFQTEETRNAGH